MSKEQEPDYDNKDYDAPFEPQEKTIEVVMPSPTATYFLEAALSMAAEDLEASRRLDLKLGNRATVNFKNEAIAVLHGIIESTQEVQRANSEESSLHHARRSMARSMPDFNAGFAVNLADDEE